MAHQVELELSDVEAGALVLERPAFQLHLYKAKTGIVSHTTYVESFAGPFPFTLDPAYPEKLPSHATFGRHRPVAALS